MGFLPGRIKGVCSKQYFKIKKKIMLNVFFKIVMAVFFIACLYSCAKLPVQSVQLMQQIKDEGQRMHKLNLAYVNLLFENKKAAVDTFMEKEYIPAYMQRVKELFDENDTKVDNNNWQTIFPQIIPHVNAARDSLQGALIANKNKITGRLNEDYNFYKQACDAQIGLLSSATKLNNTSRQIFNAAASKFSGGKTDLTQLEQTLDGVLKKGGSIAEKILGINDAIQSFITN